MREIMEAVLTAQEAEKRAKESFDNYSAALAEFRGTIKNDIASLKSSAEKVQAEVKKMGEAYAAAASALTSPEFTAAVANAERLAVALDRITSLQKTKIGFAVFGGATNE
jgi:hypothetical protein